MSRVIITSDTLTPGVTSFPERVDRGLAAITERGATQSEGQMRLNAPWTDRTSNARNGLFAKAFHEDLRHIVTLFHTVPYGIWLEVANDKKYQIIMPTVLAQGRVIMATCQGLLDRLERA